MSASDSATVTASTKRPPTASGGKVGVPAMNLKSVAVVPLLPVGQDLIQEASLKNPREAKVTYAFADSDNVLPDIMEGDLLVVSGTEYLVNYVKEYPRPEGGSFLEILLLQRKVAA